MKHVREWSTPFRGGRMVRWDAGDGKQQFGVDSWVGSDDQLPRCRAEALADLSAMLEEAGVTQLKPLPSICG